MGNPRGGQASPRLTGQKALIARQQRPQHTAVEGSQPNLSQHIAYSLMPPAGKATREVSITPSRPDQQPRSQLNSPDYTPGSEMPPVIEGVRVGGRDKAVDSGQHKPPLSGSRIFDGAEVLRTFHLAPENPAKMS